MQAVVKAGIVPRLVHMLSTNELTLQVIGVDCTHRVVYILLSP